MIRRRRRLLLASAVPALLLAVAVPAALLVDASEDDRTVVGTSRSKPAPPAPTSTSVAVTITEPPASSSSTSISSRTTTVPVTEPASPDPTEPPPTTAELSEPRCQPSLFTASAQPDKPAYRPGERVRIMATFTNTSGTTCYWASTQSSLEIRDAAGRLVGPLAIVIGDGFRWSPIAAGETTTNSMDWDQRNCSQPPPCVAAPPGQYTVTFIVDPFGSPSTSFTLVGG